MPKCNLFFFLHTTVTSVTGNLWQQCGLTSVKRRFLQKKKKEIKEKEIHLLGKRLPSRCEIRGRLTVDLSSHLFN